MAAHAEQGGNHDRFGGLKIVGTGRLPGPEAATKSHHAQAAGDLGIGCTVAYQMARRSATRRMALLGSGPGSACWSASV